MTTDPDSESTRHLRVALVLGGGGARGFAHIGVLDVLTEAGIEVVAVAGSSMGAMVGGMFAAGKLEEFRDWAVGLRRLEMVKLMDLSLTAAGAIRGDRAFSVVEDLVDGVQIENLPIGFTATAVDLVSRREVWFQRGPLDMAIRASTAIPSVIAPVELNGRILVDGAVLNPVPVAAVTAVEADLVMAVNLAGFGPVSVSPVRESAVTQPEAEWSSRMKEAAVTWFDSDMLAKVRRRLTPEFAESFRSRIGPNEPVAPDEDDLNTVDVVQASYDIMQAALTRHRLAAYTPDITVTIPKNAARTLDFHRAQEMIDLGRRLATEQLASLLDNQS